MPESNCSICTLSNRLSFPKSELESKASLTNSGPPLLSTCRICLSNIFEPACLTCGHRFCEQCLSTYWHVKNRPDVIVCPLCRANAFKVDFAKKEEAVSTEDFRKMFDIAEMNNQIDMMNNTHTLFCLRMSILMPALYFIVKLLKPPLVQIFSVLSDVTLALFYTIF